MTVDDEPTDHDKALDELEQIEKKTKTIFDDDDGESNKRPPSSDLSEPLTKRAKTNQNILSRSNDISKPSCLLVHWPIRAAITSARFGVFQFDHHLLTNSFLSLNI